MHGLRPDPAYRWARPRFAALWVLFSLAVLSSAGALAGPLGSISDFLGSAGRAAAVKAADESAAAAAAAARTTARDTAQAAGRATQSAAARVSEDGALTVTAFANGAADAAITVHSADDLIRIVDQIGGAILVTPDVLKQFEGQFVELLQKRPGAAELIAKGSEPVPVEVSVRAMRPTLIVPFGKDLSFTVDAWARRALLSQDIMKDLAARLKVIVLAPATDQVQRQAFTQALGSRVVFAESPEALSKAMANADKRFVVVVSHMEGENLVLRKNGAVVFQQSIDSVHNAVDDAKSVGLVLGCHSASSAAVTGPTDYIDALELTTALAGTASYDSPLAFLQGLTAHIGPMHIDTDVYGRLRAVGDANVTLAERGRRLAGTSGHFLVPAELHETLPLGALALSVLILAPFVAIQAVAFGWIVVIAGCGMGPAKAWRSIKGLYARLLERGDHEIDQISRAERVFLMMVGPWLLASVWMCMVCQWAFQLPLLITALLLYPFLKWLSPKTLELSLKIAPDARNRSKISFREGRETALLGYLLLLAVGVILTVLQTLPGIGPILANPGALAAEALLMVLAPVAAFALAARMLSRSPKRVAAMVNLRRGLVLILFFMLRVPVRIVRRVRSSLRPRVLNQSSVSSQ